MSMLARYLIQLALVAALFLTFWAATTPHRAHAVPAAGLSDGGLQTPDGWSWND